MERAAEIMSAAPYDWLGLVNSPRGDDERTRYREWMKIRFDEAAADLDGMEHSVSEGRIPERGERALPTKQLSVQVRPTASLSQSLLGFVNERLSDPAVSSLHKDDFWHPQTRLEVC